MAKERTEEEKVYGAIVGLEDPPENEVQEPVEEPKGEPMFPEGEPKEEKEPVKETPPPPPATDKIVELEKELAHLKGRLEATTQKQEPEKPAPTKEFKRKWQPKPEDLDALAVGGAEAQRVMEQLYDSVLEQVAELVVPYVQNVTTPMQQYMLQAQVQEHTNRFFGKHSDLKDWENECRQVADAMLANPQARFESWDAFYDAVATQVRQMKETYQKRIGGQATPAAPVAKTPPPPADKGQARPSGGGKTDEAKILEAVLNS